MSVYVLSKNGKPLMPTNSGNARLMLRQGKAKVIKRTPFTIQLTYSSNSYKQDIILGVSPGYKHVGLSAVSENKELFNSESEFKTVFIKEKVGKKVIRREVDIIVKNLLDRKMYRRNRRNRLWYRKPRFNNRGIPKGWLPPSVEHKLDCHVKLVSLVKSILPITQINIQVAAFDIQKIKNPEIFGVDYQQGEQLGFWNVREYVLYRDGHKCQACSGKSKDKVLNVHHIILKTIGGTDRPDNLITLCETCHKAYHKGKIVLDIKKHKGFKAETFMSIIRWKIVDRLKNLGNAVNVTYGYITKSARIALGLPKTHANDAFCIAGGSKQEKLNQSYFIKFVRKCNRSLFKANLLKGGKRKVNTIKQAFGFHRFDKVSYKGIECFIYGLRTSGYFDVRCLTGEKINASAKYTSLRLIETFKTMRLALLPAL
jgi:N6-L-threonylcarbamoyladenine synthase